MRTEGGTYSSEWGCFAEVVLLTCSRISEFIVYTSCDELLHMPIWGREAKGWLVREITNSFIWP